ESGISVMVRVSHLPSSLFASGFDSVADLTGAGFAGVSAVHIFAPPSLRLLRKPLIYVSYVTDNRFRRSRAAKACRCQTNESYMLPNETLIPLVLFTALLLVLSLHGLAASGQFPHEHRNPVLRFGLGGIILYGTIA